MIEELTLYTFILLTKFYVFSTRIHEAFRTFQKPEYTVYKDSIKQKNFAKASEIFKK